jgi:hypothetical protein
MTPEQAGILTPHSGWYADMDERISGLRPPQIQGIGTCRVDAHQ